MSVLKSFCKDVVVSKRKSFTIATQLLRVLFSKTPFQVAYFQSRASNIEFQNYVNQIKPDAIYTHLIRTAVYASHVNAFKVLDFMDAFSHGMSERAKGKGFLKRLFYNIESRRVARFEKLMYEQYDQTTVISDQDKVRLGFEERIHVIPNGVDFDYFKRLEVDQRYDIAFIGNLGYAPNISAVNYLVKKVIPQFKKTVGRELQVLIAGARPSSKILSYQSESISVQSWVEDIRTAYSSATVFVAPIMGGMGQQNKILEAMSIGIPCITSVEVAKGMSAEHGRHLLVAESTEGYVYAIQDLLQNEAKRNYLVEQAKQLVYKNYSWVKSSQPLVELMEQAKKIPTD